MSRPGVHYETIKQTAVKLLSQGVAPSVQKIREVLGTGSNSTIAEHLKIWREEYACKTIHHLPASMPKELISAVEVLWHAAMEQATNQVAAIKTDLNEQQEKVRLDKLAQEQTLTNLQTSLGELSKKIEEKANQNQLLNTELAVAQERLKQQADEILAIKNQYDTRLNRAYDEKNNELEISESLALEIAALQQQLTEQARNHQTLIAQERALQQQSEARWLKLIDQARTEASEQRKQNEAIISKQSKTIETLQININELHKQHIKQEAMLEQSKNTVASLTMQFKNIQTQYNQAITTIAVLQEKFHSATKNHLKNNNNKYSKKILERA